MFSIHAPQSLFLVHTMEVHGRHVFDPLNFHLDSELRAGKAWRW